MPNAKPVEAAPNAGLVGVTKLVVGVVTAAAPKVNGGGAELEAVVDDVPPPPNVNGFGGCGAEEPNVACVVEPNTGCVVGAGKDDFPKLKAG